MAVGMTVDEQQEGSTQSSIHQHVLRTQTLQNNRPTHQRLHTLERLSQLFQRQMVTDH